MGATNCPETPRQKMITMMYLVYTAMLALNVSAEVVNGFKSVATATHKSNQLIAEKLDDTYSNFDLALKNSKEKVQEKYDRAQEIKALSKDLTSFIDSVEFAFIGGEVASKAEIKTYTGEGKENEHKRTIILQDPETKQAIPDSVRAALDEGGFSWFTDKQLEDNHKPANFFLGESGVVHEDRAAFQLKQKILNYKKRINTVLGEDSALVHLGLDMSDGYDKDGKSQSWEMLNFNEVITGAALVTLTRLRAEVMNAEFDAVNMLYKQVSKGDMTFSDVAMISRPRSTYILQGGTYETKINVAAYDSKQQFRATINGQNLVSGDSGTVVYKTTCNNLGPQRITGTAYVTSPDGGTKEYPINDVYFVAKPAGVVQLDGLQVVYAGLDNPITVSAAGIDTRNLKPVLDGQGAITPGTGEGKYILKPASGQRNLTINIDATIDKKVTRVGSYRYIVKDIPAPVLSINGIQSGDKIARKDISANTVVVALKDPGFLLKIDPKMIRIMKMIVAIGSKEEPVNGPRFNESIASMIRKASKGEKLVILATVMMPDGKTKQSQYTVTLK